MYQLLITIISSISGISAALIAAFVTVRNEHKKDILERYEERADIYKREHFSRLIGLIKEYASRIDNSINVYTNNKREGLLFLEPIRMSIQNNENEFIIKDNWDNIKDKELISHLAFYPELNKLLNEIKLKENNYKNDMYDTLNSIIKELNEMKDDVNIMAPCKCPEDSKSKYGHRYIICYYEKNIISYIIDGVPLCERNLIMDKEGIKPKGKNNWILTFTPEDEGIKELIHSSVEEFLKTCKNISANYYIKLQGLKNTCININESYKQVYICLNHIIQTFESGLSIEGTCDVCKQIDKGKEEKKLMTYK